MWANIGGRGNTIEVEVMAVSKHKYLHINSLVWVMPLVEFPGFQSAIIDRLPIVQHCVLYVIDLVLGDGFNVATEYCVTMGELRRQHNFS